MSMPNYHPPRWPTEGFVTTRAQRNAAVALGIADQLRDYQNRVARIPAVGASAAAEAEEYAKRMAPWKDRTGQARRRLKVRFLDRGGVWVLQFSHGVYYGRFLEYRWGGRYAILRPAAQIFVSRLRDRLRRLFRRTVGAFSLRSVIDTSSAFDPRTRRTSRRTNLW